MRNSAASREGVWGRGCIAPQILSGLNWREWSISSLGRFGYRSRGLGFDSRRYQIFWEVVGLEQGPLRLVRITEKYLKENVAAPVQKTEINGRGYSLRWQRDTVYPLKLASTSSRSGGHSVGVVRLRTKATEFVFFCKSASLLLKLRRAPETVWAIWR
jgi:hypothetical protein